MRLCLHWRPTGAQVEAVNHPFAVYPDLDNDRGEATEKLLQAIDIAAALGARFGVFANRRSRMFDVGASRRTVHRARRAVQGASCGPGGRVLVENASSFNADIHIAHTLADTIALAELAGIGLCIEWHACSGWRPS